MPGLAQLKTFNELAEAQIVKAKLDAHDIPAFLFDEHLGGNLFPTAALTGFRLMVPEDRLEEAVRLLGASQASPE
jgi:hypothetical protein